MFVYVYVERENIVKKGKNTCARARKRIKRFTNCSTIVNIVFYF